MTIVAKTITGREFVYNAATAHKVSDRSAKTICDALNRLKYQLKDAQTWHVYKIDEYSTAFDYAQGQKFTIRKGELSRHSLRRV